MAEAIWTRGEPLPEWSDTRIQIAHDLILETTGEAYSPERLRMLPLNSDFGNWVLEYEGEMIGLLWAMGLSKTRCRVLAFCVAPDHQGDGHGTEGWRFFAEAARPQGQTNIQLEVRQSNDTAIGMYGRRGLRPAGRIVGFYGGEDGWLMLGPNRPQ